MKKNETVTVRITDYTQEGLGVGRSGGMAVFVKDTVIGDEVEAAITKVKKQYAYARLVRVLKPSPDRVEAPCPVAGPCGGCQLQMMDYAAQLHFKEEKVKNCLVRIGGFSEELLVGSERETIDTADGISLEVQEKRAGQSEHGKGDDHEKGNRNHGESSGDLRDGIMEPIMGMEYPYRYRNKAQFPVGRDRHGKLVAGFYAGRTHSIIDHRDCLIGVEENSRILDIVLRFMEVRGIEPYDENTGTGLVRHIMTRKGFATGQIMVALILNGTSIPGEMDLADDLWSIPGMTSFAVNTNTERTNVIFGSRTRIVRGPGYIEDLIGDVRFRISPRSFYQVNPAQTRRLYQTALEFAGLTGSETVWDLYCGIGTISLFLARQAKQVIGVEVIPEAIENAWENAALNGITNAHFIVGKAEEVLRDIRDTQEMGDKTIVSEMSEIAEMAPPDVIVVDPPRKGCDRTVLDTMLAMAPDRIVYVSCDPATLARDLRYLCEGGYTLRRVRTCDMFAHGVHVECVVLMSRKDA